MCIIIAGFMGQKVPIENLKQSWLHNPDGAGMCYVKDGALVIEKGFMKFKQFYERYSKVYSTSNTLIHFRIASKGIVNKENTHPFYTHSGKVAIAHNGTIPSLSERNALKSDTALLADILGSLSVSWYTNSGICELLRKVIKSKLAIMDEKGNIYFLEDSDFKKDGNAYYSNDSYKKITAPKKDVINVMATRVWGQGGVRLCPACDKPLKQTEIKNNICTNCVQELSVLIEADYTEQKEKGIKCLTCLLRKDCADFVMGTVGCDNYVLGICQYCKTYLKNEELDLGICNKCFDVMTK